jgi:hypothetical protein
MKFIFVLMFCLLNLTSFSQSKKAVNLYLSSKVNFIGSPIKFNYVEIAQYDIPKECTYDEAVNIAKNIGNGWRLPSKAELLKMYEFREKINGFVWGANYLSNELYGKNLVFTVEFADGKLDKSWRYFNGDEIHYNVRLIRTIKK